MTYVVIVKGQPGEPSLRVAFRRLAPAAKLANLLASEVDYISVEIVSVGVMS